MGYYVETSESKNKAVAIAIAYSGTIVDQQTALEALREGDGVVIIVHNSMFEAAVFAFDEQQFKEFTNDQSGRKLEFVIGIDREILKKNTNYKGV